MTSYLKKKITIDNWWGSDAKDQKVEWAELRPPLRLWSSSCGLQLQVIHPYTSLSCWSASPSDFRPSDLCSDPPAGIWICLPNIGCWNVFCNATEDHQGNELWRFSPLISLLRKETPGSMCPSSTLWSIILKNRGSLDTKSSGPCLRLSSHKGCDY